MQKLWGNFRVVGSLLLVFVLGAAFVVDTLQADALTKSAATKAQARGMVDEALKASCVGMLGVQLPSKPVTC